MSDSDPLKTFSHLAEELNELGLGYLHMIEHVGGPMVVAPEKRFAPSIRKIFSRTFILNGGYDAAKGDEAIRKGQADLISYGTLFLANPDLPERFKRNAPLNAPEIKTFYAGEERGYIDYPML
jgi:N-ethylmaleimide reductase